MPKHQRSLLLDTAHDSRRKDRRSEQVKIAAKAGYDGIELWMRDVQRFQESGGKLTELAALIKDSNLRVEKRDRFCPWIVNDEAT